MESLSNVDVNDTIRCYRWQKNDNYRSKKACGGTVADAIKKLKDQLPKFLWHASIKEKQGHAYNEDKARATAAEFPLSP